MQRKQTFLLIILVLGVIAFLLLNYRMSSFELYVYGLDTDKTVPVSEESISGLLQISQTDLSGEVLILNAKRELVAISPDYLDDFQLKRVGRNYGLYSNDRLLLRAPERIYLEPQSRDDGLYWLNGVTQKGHYRMYDLLNQFFSPEEEAETYKIGSVSEIGQSFSITVESDSLLLVFADGDDLWFQLNETRDIRFNSVFTILGDSFYYQGRLLKAIWENPPRYSSRDIFYLLRKSVMQEPTMAIFIDGLGYELWNYAEQNGYTSSYPELNPEPLRSIFPPRTIYNYYAFGTGELLRGRYQPNREIFRDPIFERHNGLIIEGEIQVYSSPLRQKLNIIESPVKTIDEAIFLSAQESISEGLGFLFIHFQGVDDRGHQYGPYSREVMSAVEDLGNYISQLQSLWRGKIYIFSDHGMHSYYNPEQADYQGTHTSASSEDIIAIFAELDGLQRKSESN